MESGACLFFQQQGCITNRILHYQMLQKACLVLREMIRGHRCACHLQIKLSIPLCYKEGFLHWALKCVKEMLPSLFSLSFLGASDVCNLTTSPSPLFRVHAQQPGWVVGKEVRKKAHFALKFIQITYKKELVMHYYHHHHHHYHYDYYHYCFVNFTIH